MKIALLNPGAMGATIGAALVRSGHEVFWVAEGRSDATASRANEAGLTPAGSLPEMTGFCEGLISVCPPHAAIDLARQVIDTGFDGVYVDANAVSPVTARTLADLLGDRFVDGGIIGPPATVAGSTRLYLSGAKADAVRAWFNDPVLGLALVNDRAGSASALKMCYASYTKGTSALLLATRALAEAEGVTDALLDEWAISQQDLVRRSEGAARGTAAKAWRFVGEMEEIGASFEAQNLPGGFHQAAAEIYRRMGELKNVPGADLSRVIDELLSRADG